MTIDQAIGEIESDLEENGSRISSDLGKAMRMGIEALKAWKEHRGTGSLMSPLLLPGETEE